MLTVASLNRINFFYPVGNTPAISLTQNLPHGKRAAVLSLGCGDLRHLLFTSHNDARPLDFTGCDLQPAVIARNALLLTLIIDDKHETHFENVWDIYYHFKITDSSLKLLQHQAQKLHALAESSQKWQSSDYGSTIQFCDDGTLREVRLIWEFYIKADASSLKRYFDKVYTVRRGKDLTGWAAMAAVRCAAPAFSDAMIELPKAHEHYWQHGTTAVTRGVLSASANFNPCFSTPDENAVLHYGTDPLLGFHLATAYAPIGPLIPAKSKGTARERMIQNLADSAKVEFHDWTRSFQKQASTTIVRFYAGDAVSFGHLLELQHAGYNSPACLYRDQFHFDPAKLDKKLYGSAGDAAPTTFDVIDTSNLADHVGALNLFAAVRPLLSSEPWGVIYTETLMKYEGTFQAALEALVCGNLQTMSLLLDLVLVDAVTNTAASAAAEISINSLHSSLSGSQTPQQQQLTRLSWKQPMRNSVSGLALPGPKPVAWTPSELARLLHSIYAKMFAAEDLVELMMKASLSNLLKHSLPNYQRASFVGFLGLVKTKVSTDWAATMDGLLDLVHRDNRLGSRANLFQELYVWLHMLGIHSMDILKNKPSMLGYRGSQQIHRWKDIPEVIAITLKVPRKHLAFYTSFRDVSAVGTPPVTCSVSNKASFLSAWMNEFSAVQIGFGSTRTRGRRFTSEFELLVDEDRKGWSGDSPLMVSFYVPTWMVLQEDRGVKVALHLSSTPQTVRAFLDKLGPMLEVFEADSDNLEQVYFSKSLPKLSARFTNIEPVKKPAAPDSKDAAFSLKARAEDEEEPIITSLISRVDILNETAKKLLKSGCDIKAKSVNPFTFEVTLGGSDVKFHLDFPVPVVTSSVKTLIARKSSYIELVANATREYHAPSGFKFPVQQRHPEARGPLLWNMPLVDLNKQPRLTTTDEQHAKLQWLPPHMGMQFSEREYHLRDNPSAPMTGEERVMRDVKESLFSIAMHFTGLQGSGRASLFAIDCQEAEGINMLVLVSSLRLDLSSRIVVLDAAAVPLTYPLVSAIMPTLDGWNSRQQICHIAVSTDELRLWKTLLPVWAERCRGDAWRHESGGGRCAYDAAGQVPASHGQGEDCLCSCGRGRFPAGFEAAGSDEFRVLGEHATRVAISPIFFSPMVEDAYCPPASAGDKGSLDTSVENEAGDTAPKCTCCGKAGAVAADGAITNNGSGGGGGGAAASGRAALRTCGGCKRARYCSRGCQRAHWKTHKLFCGN
ncbi:DUF4470 domain-containing protein [Microdochium nivale]|nr:DUF4470 domain-containing protein [Microdochium nivale]